MDKENLILETIIKYSQERRTDLTAHLPTLFKQCLNHLKKFDGNVIVELTVNTGESTYIFNEIAKIKSLTLIGLNNDASFSKIYDQIATNANYYFYSLDEVKYGQKHISECLNHEIKPQIDILFIDSSHYYDVTMKRLQNFVPLLSNNGMLILHDTYMAPINSPIFGRGWEIEKGNIMYGGWDNHRGVTSAIEDYFHIQMNEDKNFSFIFIHNGNFWSINHEYLCNGLTILRKLNIFLEKPNYFNNSDSNFSFDKNKKMVDIDDQYYLLGNLLL